MSRAALALALITLLLAVPGNSFAAAPPRGHYMCYFYDVSGYPTLAADFWVLTGKRYAGPGRKHRGRIKMGRTVAGKGHKFRFKGGAYGGWWGFYRRWNGTPTIELYNDLGSVGNGCPRGSG